MAMTLDKMFAFLLGEGEIDGCSFGDDHPTYTGKFWWRAHLRSAMESHLSAQAKVQDEDVERAASHAYQAHYRGSAYEGMSWLAIHPSDGERWLRSTRAALESFAARLSQGAQNNVSDNNERMCCSGAECGCQGVTKGQWRAHLLAKQLSHGDAVGDVYWEHADGESEMRVNWFGDPPPIGTMLYTHPAESAAVPEGWPRAVDEEMVCAHLGVANACDSYEDAKKKLNELICWHVSVAIDPSVNGGWVMVPREPTSQMIEAGSSSLKSDMDITRRPQAGTRQRGARNAYVSMLSAAPTLAGKEG